MKFILAFILLILIVVPISPQSCPECYPNVIPPVGHGFHEGRIQLNIALDPSLSGGDTMILNWGVDEATADWNSARFMRLRIG
jgi:hypothetical protein